MKWTTIMSEMKSLCTGNVQNTWLVGWLEFNIPFQHKYGYIRDDMKTGNADAELMCRGRPFKVQTAATGNARSPMVERCMQRMTSNEMQLITDNDKV